MELAYNWVNKLESFMESHATFLVYYILYNMQANMIIILHSCLQY